MTFYLYDDKFLVDDTGAFAIHEDCCCLSGSPNDQWRRCDTDADLAVLSDGYTSLDYAWLCDGSVWRAAYNAYSVTSGSVSTPAVLEPCDPSVPTSCTDLSGWPLDDGFTTSEACDSHDLSGFNATFRWDGGFNTTFQTWNEGYVDFDVDNPQPTGVYTPGFSTNFPGQGSDFEVGFSFSDFAHRNLDVVNDTFRIYLYAGAPTFQMFKIGWSTSQSKVYVWAIEGTVGGGFITRSFGYLPSGVTAGKVRFRRVSGTFYWDFDPGTGWTNIYSAANSWTYSKLAITTYITNTSRDNRIAAHFTDVFGLDSNGDPIYIDPDGTSRGDGC